MPHKQTLARSSGEYFVIYCFVKKEKRIKVRNEETSVSLFVTSRYFTKEK